MDESLQDQDNHRRLSELLRLEYQRNLPNILRRLTVLWNFFRQSRRQDRALRLIVQRLHGLVSSASTYKFAQIEQLVRPMERLATLALNDEISKDTLVSKMPSFLNRLKRELEKLNKSGPKKGISSSIRTGSKMGSGTVLIIKEDDDMSRWLREHLTLAGFETIVMREGRHAIREAEQIYPDVILLSLFLPDSDGLDICQMLSQKAGLENVPIVILTSIQERDDILKAYANGADDYVSIPLDEEIMVAKVRAMITRRQLALAQFGFELRSGFIFDDRYRILELLGQGGFGEVYRVLDLKTGHVRALKILRSDTAIGVQTKERFQSEIEALQSLDHPRIIGLHNAGMFRDRPYFTMDYYSEGSLSQRLANTGAFNVITALKNIEFIARALHSAHLSGILHRDIKADNILYDESLEPVLTDFGLAIELNSKNTRLTEDGFAVGTPYYMSPEQIKMSVGLDPRSDIYSLGVLFFEMLTGFVPFESMPPKEVFKRTLTGKFPDIRQIIPFLSIEIAIFLGSMTRRDRENRPPSAKAVAEMALQLRENFIEKGLQW
ncbi:MAG: protein kinase [Planctomycetota bacterium]|nr:protein kinase [Planctomycetota bacterium]